MSAPIRNKLEPGIYERVNAAGERLGLEITFKDATGSQRRRTVDGSIMAARNELAKAKAQRAANERMPEDPRVKFDTAADAWWQTWVPALRPNTRDGYKYALRRVRPTFGRRRLSDITPAEIARYIAQHKGSASTVRTDLVVIGRVFDYARKRMGLATVPNPVELLEDTERPASHGKRKRALSAVELGKLFACAGDARLLYEVGAETGGRIGEVLGLTWDDADLEAETIRFQYQLQNGERVELKSAAARRTLEVSSALIAKLREHKIAAPPGATLVFCSRTGRPLDDGNVNSGLGRAARRAGLEPITFHWLRHAHASALIRDGWDVVEVAARLGHSEAATTLRTYAHEFTDAKASAERRARLPQMSTAHLAVV